VAKRKLLLADGSATIQKVVNLTFAGEGIDVVAVGSGGAAMKKFVESAPDLVLVDVNLPEVGGYKICEMIKQDDETRHIPVVLLVGSHLPFDEAEARRVGADDFLTKPFESIRQLVDKVSALLEKRTAQTMSPPSVNLSPEAIEQIAAKVVEKLSDQVLREIARETVPQIADLVVQKMTREKSTEKSA
jgi:CheY-like chemotaxis protein